MRNAKRELAPVFVAGLALAPFAFIGGCGAFSGDDSGATAATGGSSGVAGAGAVGGAGMGGVGGIDAGSDAAGAGGLDANPDAPADATGGADAATDTGPDAEPDAAPDAPVSLTCGDGIRDPITEECDDGNTDDSGDACSNDCRVLDMLFAAEPGSTVNERRQPGDGRHTVAAGVEGFAAVFVDRHASPKAVRLRVFDSTGVPGKLVTVVQNSSVLDVADPVVAALPGNQYAVVYTDLGLDGFGRGVALRIVDGATGSVGALVRVNGVTQNNQERADVVWTGSELVVGYVSFQGAATFNDLYVAKLTAAGGAKGSSVLANTPDADGRVTLAPFASDYAVAWVQHSASAHTLFVRAKGKQWTLTQPPTMDADSNLSLVALDASRLFMTFIEGGNLATYGKLQGVVIDTAAPAGTLLPFEIAPLVQPYAGDPTLEQTQPVAASVGDRVFIIWRSSAVLQTTALSELWLKELPWSVGASGVTVDLSKSEIPLPRTNLHTNGHQSYPGLAVMPLGSGSALASAWEDQGKSFGATEGFFDVVSELIPIPVVRLPEEGGLQ